MTPELHTRFAFAITARIGEVTIAGDVGHGVRRIIPITGGEVKGERVNGKVLPFGADFQIIRPNELIDLEARYAFETDDGAVVYVENKGIRFPHRAEIRNRCCKIPLVDGAHFRRLRRASRRPRGDRRAYGVVGHSCRPGEST